MLIRITISIVSVALGAGCSNPEEKPIQSPQAESQEEELPKQSTAKSFLDDEEEGTDYRDKYTVHPPADNRWVAFPPFRSERPPTWFWVAPSSSFVLCNYVVPGVENSELAMFSISHFEKGQGGDLSLNLERWKSKFNTHEGAPVRPTIDTIFIHGTESTVVEFRGEYMGAGAAWHRPDQTLLVAVFTHGFDTYYFKLLGPTITIEAHRESFFQFLEYVEVLTTGNP